MSVASVKYTYKGTEYTLVLNESTGKYEATVPAGAVSSWDQTDHVFGGTIVAVDDAGNSTTKTEEDFANLKIRVLEKDAPTVTVTFPAADARVTTDKPTFKFTVADSESGVDLTSLKLTIDSTVIEASDLTIGDPDASGVREVSYTPATGLAEGAHTVKAYAADNDGNTTETAATSFNIDTVPPTLNVSSPADGLITNAASVTVEGTTNDATSTPVTLTVNGEAVTVGNDGSFSKEVTLAEGSNTITVVATDAAGLSSTITRTVIKNTKAPEITSVTITPNPVDAGATFVIAVEVSDE